MKVKYKFKTKPYKHQISAWKDLGTKRTMLCSWRWEQVNQKF